jgi:hypothetical protein
MAICKFCGKSAGWFSDVHPYCKSAHDSAEIELASMVADFLSDSTATNQKNRVAEICQKGRLSPIERVDIEERAISQHIDAKLREGLITESDERVLLTKLAALQGEPVAPLSSELTFSMLSALNDDDFGGPWLKLLKNALLRDLLSGELPHRVVITDAPPFNMTRDESFVWAFTDVGYYEHQTKRQYVGGSHGMSVRIMKGLYYRFGAYQGEVVAHDQMVHRDTGLLAITSKNLYFSGSTKRFRIALAKIAFFEPFKNGTTIQMASVSSKPQYFVTGDGWFTTNLLKNLAAF